jgi:hypothetical protein
MRQLFKVKFGKKLEWLMYIQADTPKDARRKTKAFMCKNGIKGKIKIGG